MSHERLYNGALGGANRDFREHIFRGFYVYIAGLWPFLLCRQGCFRSMVDHRILSTSNLFFCNEIFLHLTTHHDFHHSYKDSWTLHVALVLIIVNRHIGRSTPITNAHLLHNLPDAFSFRPNRFVRSRGKPSPYSIRNPPHVPMASYILST